MNHGALPPWSPCGANDDMNYVYYANKRTSILRYNACKTTQPMIAVDIMWLQCSNII